MQNAVKKRMQKIVNRKSYIVNRKLLLIPQKLQHFGNGSAAMA
jgi:hypothetical protein